MDLREERERRFQLIFAPIHASLLDQARELRGALFDQLDETTVELLARAQAELLILDTTMTYLPLTDREQALYLQFCSRRDACLRMLDMELVGPRPN